MEFIGLNLHFHFPMIFLFPKSGSVFSAAGRCFGLPGQRGQRRRGLCALSLGVVVGPAIGHAGGESPGDIALLV